MRTNALHSRWFRACMILSLLVWVGALPAADSAQARTTPQGQDAPYADAGLNDPCAVSQAVQTGTDGAVLSDPTVPLANLLSRTKSQTKAATGPAQGAPLTQALWSNRVAAPPQGKEAEASLSLKRLVRQVRSMKFEGKDAGPTFQSPAESLPSEELSQGQLVETDTTGSTTPESAPPVTPATGGSRPSKAQKTLEILQQNPDQVHDPLEMAELLFLSGRPVEAAPFYAKALASISPSDPANEADRAWVLFQLGNCLRETDVAKAQETYIKLIADYPTSPWTELAKAHGRLLTWYQKSQPGQTTASPQL
jgi:tetratricopeptide (TPR) repeat protein